MKIIAVDDEILALKNLELKLKDCDPESDIYLFQREKEALEWMETQKAEIAFLDIHMGEMGGIALAKEIREKCPDCSIIFVTGFSEYAVEAFAMKVSGYLLKPVTKEDLKRELEYVKSKKFVQTETLDKLKIQCFGNFEVFYHGKPISFSRSKSRELFAYLVDRRGGAVTMAEIAAVLWNDGKFDHSRNNQIHSFLHDLKKTLEQIGKADIILKKRNAVAIDTTMIDCDYYKFLSGDVSAVNMYRGEYMTQYWWSEFTTGGLTEYKYK